MQSVETTLRQASRQLAGGHAKAALSLLDDALASRPGFPPLLSLKAVALLRDGQGEAALRQAQAALEPQPDWPDGLANLGYVLFGLGRQAEAETALRRALAKDPKHEAAALTLGHLLARAERADEAVALLRGALAQRPRHPALTYNLALALKQSGRNDEALQLFRELATAEPIHVEAANQAAALLLAVDQPAEALQLLDRAIARHPDHARSHNNRGTALRALQRRDEARAAYRRSAELQPDRPDGWRNLGLLAADMDSLAEAAEAFRRALALAPDDAVSGHMLDAVEGRTTAAPPEAFIVASFDAYAPIFERQLVERLGYRAPWALAELARRLRPEGRFETALDVGCGTGLVAEAFGDSVASWTGIDLAPRMLELAAQKKRYARLELSEAVAFLEKEPTRWDLVAAADLLIYLGDIAPLFAAAAARLTPEGLFLVSTERALAEEGAFKLRSTGRYAQSDRHIAEIAQRSGLAVLAQEPTVLRQQHGADVAGTLFALTPGNLA
jgi:predicted TPR repeat methyltransferase